MVLFGHGADAFFIDLVDGGMKHILIHHFFEYFVGDLIELEHFAIEQFECSDVDVIIGDVELMEDTIVLLVDEDEIVFEVD